MKNTNEMTNEELTNELNGYKKLFAEKKMFYTDDCERMFEVEKEMIARKMIFGVNVWD